MSEREESRLLTVTALFLIGGVVGSLTFAWGVTRQNFHDMWFRLQEFWVFPTRALRLFATGIFFLSLAAPYSVAHMKKWLSFPARRLLIAFGLFALLPVFVWLTEPLFPLTQYMVSRIALAALLSLMLFAISHRWYTGLAAVIFFVALLSSVLAAIPYLFLQRISPEWYEVSKYVVTSTLLAGVFGYWLARAPRLPTTTTET